CTVTVTGSLDCAVASDRTCTTLMPGCMSAGICARIWPAAVCNSGSAVSLNVTHDPPSTVGGGITVAAAGIARFVPATVTKDPGLKLGVPSLEFTMPRAPAAIAGRVLVLAGVVEIALNPERVIAYALPLVSATSWRVGTLARAVPKTLVTGFSGTTPARVS